MTRRNRLIAWLLGALASLGVIVVVISGGIAPVVQPSPKLATATVGVGVSTTVPTTETASVAVTATLPPIACNAGDQAQYIYHPARLQVVQDCIIVTGTVAVIRHEADGDLHILLALDPVFASLVNAVNVAKQQGDLVSEPVCVLSVTQADAIALCQSDTDPVDISGLAVGEHVSMTGRYVLDTQHGGWSEMHPLAAWGVLLP